MNKRNKVISTVTVINLVIWMLTVVCHYILAQIRNYKYGKDNIGVETYDKLCKVEYFLDDISSILFLGTTVLTLIYLCNKKKIASSLDMKESLVHKIVFLTYYITQVVFSYIAYAVIQLTCKTGYDYDNAQFYAKRGIEGEVKVIAYNYCKEMRLANLIFPVLLMLVFFFIYKWRSVKNAIYSELKLDAVGQRVCIIFYTIFASVFLLGLIYAAYNIVYL